MNRQRLLLALPALLLFVVTLALGWPLAGWSRWVDWPPGWQPQGLHGTLLAGRIERLGPPPFPLGPVEWHLQSVFPPRLQASLALHQDRWQLQAHGWPWQWQGQVTVARGAWQDTAGLRWQGRWHGELAWQARGMRCLATHGQLQADDVLLTAPLTLPLGQLQARLQCGPHAGLLAELQQPGRHRLSLRLDGLARQASLVGELDAADGVATWASLAELTGIALPADGKVDWVWRW